jgi:hypothetical protein
MSGLLVETETAFNASSVSTAPLSLQFRPFRGMALRSLGPRRYPMRQRAPLTQVGSQGHGWQGHTPQGDWTGEFLFIADRPVDNSRGDRSRLPLQFGGDQRSIGRMEFANFAMLPMPGHRLKHRAHATRLGEVADFRAGAP